MDKLIFINEKDLAKYKTTGSIIKREEGRVRPNLSSIPFNLSYISSKEIYLQLHNIRIDSDAHLEKILEHIFTNKRRIYKIIDNPEYERTNIIYYTTYDTFKKVEKSELSDDYRQLVQYYKYAYSRRKELRNDPITSRFRFNNERTGEYIYLDNVDLYNMLYTDKENYFIILDHVRKRLLDSKNGIIFSDEEFVIPNINGGGNITRKIRLDDNNKKYFKFNNKKIYITGTPNTKKIGNITIRLLY